MYLNSAVCVCVLSAGHNRHHSPEKGGTEEDGGPGSTGGGGSHLWQQVSSHLSPSHSQHKEGINSLLSFLPASFIHCLTVSLLCPFSASRLSVCPVVQLRKNPPSPLNRGKRISGTKEKFRKSGKKFFTCSPQSHSLPMQFCIVCYGHIMFVDIAGSSIVGPPISPSPTTGSFGSGLIIANFLQCSLT